MKRSMKANNENVAAHTSTATRRTTTIGHHSARETHAVLPVFGLCQNVYEMHRESATAVQCVTPF